MLNRVEYVMLNRVEYEKSFITSGPGVVISVSIIGGVTFCQVFAFSSILRQSADRQDTASTEFLFYLFGDNFISL